MGSNLRPAIYKTAALPTELCRHIVVGQRSAVSALPARRPLCIGYPTSLPNRAKPRRASGPAEPSTARLCAARFELATSPYGGLVLVELRAIGRVPPVAVPCRFLVSGAGFEPATSWL